MFSRSKKEEPPGPQLETHASHWPTECRRACACAAKLAALTVLEGRFPARDELSTAGELDDDDDTQSDAQDAKREQKQERRSKALDNEQESVQAIRDETVEQATTWLAAVCAHTGVELDSLPDSLAALSQEAALEHIDDQNEHEGAAFELAHDLVVVSLGLTAARDTQALDYAPVRRALVWRALCALVRDAAAPNVHAEQLARELATRLDLRDEQAPAVFDAGSAHGSTDEQDESRESDENDQVAATARRALEGAEKALAQLLYFQLEQARAPGSQAQKEVDGALSSMDAAASAKKDEANARRKKLKWAATGAGFILGGVAIGLTGGLAAPAIAPLLVGTTGLSFFATSGGAILVGTLFGLTGGGLASYRTHRRMKGIDEFAFEPVVVDHDIPSIPALTSVICVSGFLLSKDDVVQPWIPRFGDRQVDTYALRVETETFMAVGKSLDNYIRNWIVSEGSTEILKRTVLAGFYAGAALPLSIIKGAGMLFDSDMSRCRDKAQKAGVLLADVLAQGVHGNRPVTLVGYGIGAAVIFECLLELHARGIGSAVYDAILISAPLSPSGLQWARARAVVARKLVNAYSSSDFVLAILARSHALFSLRPSLKVAGLSRVDNVPGLANVDVSDIVGGHLELNAKLDAVLGRVLPR